MADVDLTFLARQVERLLANAPRGRLPSVTYVTVQPIYRQEPKQTRAGYIQRTLDAAVCLFMSVSENRW